MRMLFISIVSILCLVSSVIGAESAQKMYLSASQAERAGDTSTAKDMYEKIISSYPDSPLAIKASDRLLEYKKAYDARVAASIAAQQRAADATAEAKRLENQKYADSVSQAIRQGQVQAQQDKRQCESERMQCEQNCSLRYRTYDERYSSCTMGCGSDRCRNSF